MIKPEQLTIEPNASCQLRCPECPTTSVGYPPEVGKGRLTFEDFKKILDENDQIKRVLFESRGELFINPDFLKIIEYGYNKAGVTTAIGASNMNTVHEGVLEGLVKYGCQSLVCAIDGATPETYAIYRRGGDLNTVIGHIEEINRYKKQYNSRYPELTWQYVVFGHNEHEIPMAREMAKRLGMRFVPKMAWDPEFSPIRDPEFVKRETGWETVTRDEFAQGGKDYVRNVCYTLWTSPRINWDGKVLGCCWNSWGNFGGNAFSDGLVTAINNEKINHARAMLMGKAEPVEGIPCTTCALYESMKESGNFLTENEIHRKRSLLYRGARYVYRRLPMAQRLKEALTSR